MFGATWMLSILLRSFLQRFMPTNILLAAIFTRRGLKWGLPAMLITGPYLLAAALCTELIAQGAPDWVNLLVLLSLWNAAKFAFAGPVSLIWLIHVRAREARGRRMARVSVLRLGRRHAPKV